METNGQLAWLMVNWESTVPGAWIPAELEEDYPGLETVGSVFIAARAKFGFDGPEYITRLCQRFNPEVPS